MNRFKVGRSVRGAALVLLCIVAHLALPASPVAAHAFLEEQRSGRQRRAADARLDQSR